MITEDLIAYIQAQLRKDISKDIVRSRLTGAGWHIDDVEEAFRKLTPPVIVSLPKVEVRKEATAPTPVFTPSVAQVPPDNFTAVEPKKDPYHEDITGGEPAAMDKVWTPIKIPPKVEHVAQSVPEKKAEAPSQPIQTTPFVKPVFSTSFSEANPKQAFTREEVIAPTPIEPRKVPINTTLEVYNEELMPTLTPKNVAHASPLFTAPIVRSEPARSIDSIQTAPVEPVTASNPVPLDRAASFSAMKMTSVIPPSNMPEAMILPNGAILHSYKRAMMSATEVGEQSSKGKKSTLIKWLAIILIASVLVGALIAFLGKHIKMPSFSLIKKDPKMLLATAPITLSELKAYKIDTNAVISVPPLGNITSGLISGLPVTSNDKDTFSLSAVGIVNHENPTLPVFDYKATFKSSLFNKDLVADLKYNNLISLITTPDLRELLGENAPEVSNVLVPKGQFDVFTALLPDTLQSKAEKIDIDKLFSVGVPSYINNETSGVFKSFVDSATVIEKEPETVHGIVSYHYELSADQQSTKKFIMEFVTVFTTGLSPLDKDLLADRLGAISLDSFEVWVGKEDSKIHQYKLTLKSPLSRLIGLDDSGIAGNVVTLDWKTTYYDFDIHNDISIPTDAIPASLFMKKVSDMKIKDKISSFKALAGTFHNAIGTFGTRSNPTGSCTNPNPSSLFSPVGHAKGASAAVGTIASVMNDILSTTGGALACYSTSSAWALAAPLPSDPSTSFCADNTGAAKILVSPITGPVCK
jgi:hypothetical protein